MIRRLLLCGALLALLVPGSAFAAEANDAFSGATTLTLGGAALTGSTVTATTEPGEPEHGFGAPAHSVWFRYTAASSRTVEAETCGSGFDTLLAVYTGAAVDALTVVGRDDDGEDCGVFSSVSFEAVAGTTYWIALDGYDGETGSYSVRLRDASVANDDRSRPRRLDESRPATGSTVDATKEPGEADHGGDPGGHSVWFNYYASTTAPVLVEACGSTFDTTLAVYEDSYGGGQEVASNDDTAGCGPGGKGSRVVFYPISPGGFEIALDGHGGATGDYRISVLGNDDYQGARALYSGEVEHGFSNAHATAQAGEPAHAGSPAAHSVWFAVPRGYPGAPVAGQQVTFDTCSTPIGGLDTVVAAYTLGAGGAPVELASSDDALGCGPGGRGSSVTFTLPTGPVAIAVDGRAGATGQFSVRLQAPPGNDDRAGAYQLFQFGDWQYGETTSATREPGEPDHAGVEGGRSVWYQLRTSTTRTVVADTCDSSYDTLLAVYTESYGGLQEVAANDDADGCDGGSRVSFVAQADQTYYVAVDGRAGASGYFTLRTATGAANDAFAFAQSLSAGSGFASGNTGLATAEPGEPAHAGSAAAHSLWYRLTVADTASRTVETCSSSSAPTRVAVYEGSALGSLSPVASSGPVAGCASGRGARVQWRGGGGTRTYWIAVDAAGASPAQFSLTTAQPPYNDDRAAAATLYDDFTQSGYNANASHEADEPDHAGAGGTQSVWYRWRPNRSAPARVSTCGSNASDTIVAVYTEGYGGLQEIGASDDAAGCGDGRQSRVDFAAQADTTYLIAVDARVGGAGPFTISPQLRPANDDRADAYTVSQGTGTMYGSLGLATKETGEPDHAGRPGGHSIWYRWTAAGDGPVALDTCGTYNGTADTQLAVYTESYGGLQEVASNDDAAGCGTGGKGSRVGFEATGGRTYLIAVDAADGGSGTVVLGFPPYNDHFSGAPSYFGETISTGGDIQRATAQAGEPAHGGAAAARSVWFDWTPARSALATIETCGSSSTRVAAYTGVSVGALTAVTPRSAGACPAGQSGSRLRFDAVAGTTYRIAVDGGGGTSPYYSLSARLAPANDDLANAAWISEGVHSADTRLAGREPDEADHAGAGGDASVWYRWSAPHDGPVRIDTCETGSGFDSALAVFRQGGAGHAGLVPVAASDDADGCAKGGRVRFEAARGVTYLIAVDGHDAARGLAQLALEQAPANDDLAAATSLGDRSTVAFGDTLEATREPDEPGGGSASAWYRWVPAHEGAARIDTCDAADFESVVAVYGMAGGGMAGLAPVTTGSTGDSGCAGGRGSRAAFRAEAGRTYLIAVDGEPGASGRFELDVVLAPDNDDAARAALLQPRVPVSLPTDGATRESGEPVHGGTGGASVWYRFTAARTGDIALTTCGSDYDTLLAVYSGAPGALTQRAADDDGGDCGAGTSRVVVAATAGTEYRVAVDGRDGATGGLALTLDPPANDRFQDAETLTGRPASAAGSTIGASAQAGEPWLDGFIQPSHTAWWRWTAPETRTVTISTCGSSATARLGVFTGTQLSSVSQVGTAAGSCSGGRKVSLAAVAGTTYRIQVDTPFGVAVQLHVDAPDHDDFFSARALTLGTDDTVGVDGSVLGAGREPGELALTPAAVGRTVWYSWTAVSGAPVEVDTCESTTPAVVRPFRGRFTPQALRSDAEPCPDGSQGERVRFDGVANQTYWFGVDGVSASSGAFRLRLAQKSDVTPPVSRFTLAPGAFTNADPIEFRFTADETATFECALDDASLAGCTSPVSSAGLEEGRHTFTVVATDRAGNVEPGPLTAEFEIDRTAPDTALAGGPTEPVHGSVSWQLTSTEPVQGYRCSVDGAPRSCSFSPTSLSPGAHTFAAAAIDRAGNVDPTPATGAFEVVDEPPEVDPHLTPASGAAPLPVSLALGASDPDGDPLSYEVDWGDGSQISHGTVSGATPPAHEYSEPGSYTIAVKVKDPWLETVATRVVEVAPGEPLAARAGEDRTVEAGEPLLLDGGDSRPLAGIERYHWEFGDGTFADGRSVGHTYADPGTYTARLTVTKNGESRNDETSVRVVAPAPGGLTVTTSSGGQRLAGTDVALIDADNRRFSGASNGEGTLRLRGVPDGEYTLYAFKQGYQATTAAATVAGGSGTAAVELVPGDVVAASLTSRPLTLDEILARGIDPNDPANQHVYEFETVIGTVPVRGAVSAGGFWGATIGGGSCSISGCVSHSGGHSYYTRASKVGDHMTLTTMVVPFKASWLKEFFDVSMVVQNLAPSGFTLTGGRAQLNVPPGLSLAPTAAPQSASMPVGDIPGRGSRTFGWTVRGDDEGSYKLSATYSGRLDPTGGTVGIRAETSRPLKVWGSSALELEVVVDQQARDRHPFLATVKMKNVADVPVYNAATELLAEGADGYIEQPRQRRSFGTREIKPGMTFEAGPFLLVPGKSGEVDLAQSFIKKTGGNADPVTTISTRDRVPALDDDPELKATPLAERIEFDWESIPGARGYELYRTSENPRAPFSGEPVASSASSKATISVPSGEPEQLYAVSSIVDGRRVLRHPAVAAASGTEDPPATTEDPEGMPEATCDETATTRSQLRVGPVNLRTGCFRQVATGVWESEAGALGRVRAGGVDLTPTGSGKVRVSVPDLTVSIDSAKLAVGDWVLYQGRIGWDFARPISVGVPANATFKGLPVTGSVELDFDLDHVDLTATAGLPSKFGGVTGDLALKATADEGLVLGEVKIAVPQAPIGKLGLRDISLSYSLVGGKHRWEGGASVMLPAKGFAESVSGKMAFLGGSFESASVEVQGLNRPLGTTGIFLQRVRLRVVVQPRVGVGGGLGISLGPRVLGHEAVSLDGDVDITFGDPITYAANGTLKVVDATIATGYFKYALPNAIDFGGSLDLSKEILGSTLGVAASMDGWVAGSQAFNVQGNGTISGPGWSNGGEAVLSTDGVAACRRGSGPDVGAGYRWESGDATWFASSCSISDYVAARPALRVRRLRGRLVETRALPMEAGTPTAVFAITGETAPPKVTLTGPAGETVATPAGPQAVSTPRFFLMQSPGDRTTYVAVDQPSAGSWDIRSQPGSSRVTEVRQAGSLPPATVDADVRGTGAGRELDWSLEEIDGQEVTLVAEGNGTRQVLAETADAAGSIAFAPEPGPAGRRVVRAYVTQNGLPRETIDVAAFDVAEVLVAPNGLRLERGAADPSAVVGTWDASAAANGYRATLEVSDGRRIIVERPVGDRSVTVTGVPDTATVTLEVATRTPTGGIGPSSVVQLGGPAGAAPAVTIERPDTVHSGDAVTLAATAAPGADAVGAIGWELDGDGDHDDATGPTTTHRFDRPGLHPVGVRVTDAAGRVTIATQTVEVLSRAPAAAVAAPAGSPLVGETVTVTGTDSDPDGIVLSRDWDLDGDGSFDDAQGDRASTSFASAGAHRVGYRVIDDAGRSFTAERTITVAANRAPVLAVSVAPESPVAGRSVDVKATATDPDGRPLEAVTWDLDGDGRFGDAAAADAKWTFPSEGQVTIRARVADSGGLVTTAERAVTVRPAPAAEQPGPGSPADPATTPTPTPAAPGGGSGPVPAPVGGLITAKSVKRAALLRSGLELTLTGVRRGARLDAKLTFAPRRGRAVALGQVTKTATRAGRMTVRIKLTRAGRRALRRPAPGRLSLSVTARSGSEPAVTLKRALRYRP